MSHYYKNYVTLECANCQCEYSHKTKYFEKSYDKKTLTEFGFCSETCQNDFMKKIKTKLLKYPIKKYVF